MFTYTYTAGQANQVLWDAKQVWQNVLFLYVLVSSCVYYLLPGNSLYGRRLQYRKPDKKKGSGHRLDLFFFFFWACFLLGLFLIFAGERIELNSMFRFEDILI